MRCPVDVLANSVGGNLEGTVDETGFDGLGTVFVPLNR